MPKPTLNMREFVALFSLITSLTAVSIDAMLPALGDIGRALSVSDANDTQLIVSMFILGMVFGEVIFGPVSDAIGRKKAILIGLLIYAAGAMVAMAASSIEQILIGRIIQGIGAAGPKIASRALIRDQYEGDAMARIMSFIYTIFILVPMIAPALGQLVAGIAGWRAIFVLYLLWAGAVALWLGVRQPETLTPDRRIPISLRALASNTKLVAGHARVMAYTVSAGFIFGSLLLYLSTAQALFLDLYKIDELFPLYFALLSVGTGLAFFINSQLVMRYGMFRLSVVALSGLALFGGLLMASSLMFDGVPPFALFMALCFMAFSCNGLLIGNLNAMAMQSLGRVAGLGASLVASISSLVAVIMSVTLGRFYDQSALPLAAGFMLAGLAALVLVLLARKSRADAV